MNNFSFAGNLTKDPELRKTQSGKSVCGFSVALNDGDKTTYVDCIAWDKGGEIIAQYCKKGDRLSGHGRLSNRSWEHEGRKHYKTEIIVSHFDLPPKAKGESIQDPPPENNLLDDEIPF